MSPGWRSVARAVRASACIAMSALAGCVTTYETTSLVDAPSKEKLATPPSVTIPFGADGSPSDSEFTRFYQRVFERMQEAAAERDVQQLEILLASYDREDLPVSIRERVAGYRAVARGLRFVAAAAAAAKLVLLPTVAGKDEPPALGAVLRYELQLPALGEPYQRGGPDEADPFGVSIAYVVADTFVDGGTQSTKERRLEYLPAAFTLQGAAVLRIPIEIDVPAGNAVHRNVRVRVDTLPGSVRTEAGTVPVGQATLARTELPLWPKGHEAVRAAPVQQLRTALQAFEPRNFARAYLAATFAPPESRGEVLGLLIEQVRLGQPDQAQVAMAAMKAITEVDLPIGDRDAWLAWWQARR